MARSKWRFSFFSNFILRKIVIFKNKSVFRRKNLIFYDRLSNIPKCFNNLYFRIYKGNNFRSVKINNNMIGYKFGEFSFTRKPFHFPLRKMNKRKNFLLRK